jgi:hypothetical protein
MFDLTHMCCWIDIDIVGSVEGVVLSCEFKTVARYQHQPLTLNGLVQVYIDRFRVGGDDDPHVFLTTKGTPMLQGYVNDGNFLLHFVK